MSQSLGLHRLRLTFFTQCISFLLVPACARDSAASHQWVGAVWLAGLAPWLANAGTIQNAASSLSAWICFLVCGCIACPKSASRFRCRFWFPSSLSNGLAGIITDKDPASGLIIRCNPLDMIDVPHLVPLYCCGPTMHCAAIVVPLIRRMVRGGGLECFFVSSASSFSSSHPISSSNYLYDS
ncbi:hypothetical protein BJ166DRAFT_230668 [Pestalotiopsis sp. NC0098]|nr:hypothetical protein BJ166DRAFT_230668 [Pestalotiopsis sp. NC0098]